jgi:hypothetical protein
VYARRSGPLSREGYTVLTLYTILILLYYHFFSASGALNVAFVDYQTKLNRKNHNTNEFEKAGNIIRRGQEFVISVVFDREVKSKHDAIILQFTYGTAPNLIFMENNYQKRQYNCMELCYNS